MVEGFLVVDKPSGCTSHDVVDRVRRATGIRKAGHAGTLDPLATGVVVVALGRATRLIRFLQDFDKEYVATARFGIATDTLDADGTEVSRREMPVSPEALDEIVPEFLGTILQVPPMVSALKVDGKRLYELAREGIEVEREARPVDVHELEILSVGAGSYPLIGFRVVCGKGTYVRVLADDMAAALGGHAHLTSLRRTRTGRLEADAHGVSLDDLPRLWESRLIAPADGLVDLPCLQADDRARADVSVGRSLLPNPIPQLVDGDLFRVLGDERSLLAVYRVEGDAAKPEVVLA